MRDIFVRFECDTQIYRPSKAGLPCKVTEKFTQIDLHPDKVSNHQMGLVFEELIRRFAELANETVGEHFTPREVIQLMVDLIFAEDGMDLSKPSIVRTIYDPTAGTGGMLSVTEAGSAGAQDKEKALLSQILNKLNDLLTGDLSDNDLLSHAMTAKGKLPDNQVLVQQAANSLKE